MSTRPGSVFLVWLALASLVLLSSFVHGDKAGAVPDRVEAREFVLRDKAGRVRATLGFGDEDSVVFSLRSAKGKPGADIFVNGDGHAQVVLVDPGGNERLVLALDNHGPSLRMHPEARHATAAVELACGTETGSKEADVVQFTLTDPKSRIGHAFVVTPGEAVLQILDGPGKKALLLKADRGGGAIEARDGKQSRQATFK